MNNLPIIKSGVLVCIICEGPEEYDYLNTIKALGVWDEGYRVDLVNAEGNGNLPARYQDKYQNGLYDVVLVICDTDKKPFEQYQDIKRKIDAFHGRAGVADLIIMYGNPCTMQIVVQHWGEVSLRSPSKHSNAAIIEELTGIKQYDAHSDQREEMMQMINIETYRLMMERVEKMSSEDAIVGSSNFNVFMSYLAKDNYEWIKEINKIIEE